MIQNMNSVEVCWEFVSQFHGDFQFSDLMLSNEEQFQNNIAKCMESPEKHGVWGVYLDGQMIGLFAFLILKEERYIEMLVGLSRVQSAYEEIFRCLEQHYPGYDADFVFNPENHLLKQLLKMRNAEFEPEQQKMVFLGPVKEVDTTGVELYSEKNEGQYLAIHNKDMYWTADKVLAALDRFRVFVAMDEGNVVGYLDVTHCFDQNEPYDLFVLEEYRRMGYGRKLMAKALERNQPSGMMLMVGVDQTPAIQLFESVGFETVEHQNNLTAHWKVSHSF